MVDEWLHFSCCVTGWHGASDRTTGCAQLLAETHDFVRVHAGPAGVEVLRLVWVETKTQHLRTKASGASIARVRTCTCMHTVHVRVCTVHAHFTRTCTVDRQIDDALYFLYVRYELLSNIFFSAFQRTKRFRKWKNNNLHWSEQDATRPQYINKQQHLVLYHVSSHCLTPQTFHIHSLHLFCVTGWSDINSASALWFWLLRSAFAKLVTCRKHVINYQTPFKFKLSKTGRFC